MEHTCWTNDHVVTCCKVIRCITDHISVGLTAANPNETDEAHSLTLLKKNLCNPQVIVVQSLIQRCFTSLQKHSREQQEEGGGGNASHRVAYDIKQDGLLLVLKNKKKTM